jgi:RNA exonuclease 1
MQLLGQEGAVLIGHALHHDLCALRLDFQPVLDTSLLFSYRRASAHAPAASPPLLFPSLCDAILTKAYRRASAHAPAAILSLTCSLHNVMLARVTQVYRPDPHLPCSSDLGSFGQPSLQPASQLIKSLLEAMWIVQQ